MVSVREQLARRLHQRHNEWDACAPTCRQWYLQLADDAMSWLEAQWLPDVEKAMRLRIKLEEQRKCT